MGILPMPVAFQLNGKQVQASGFPAHTTLLDFIRAEGLTGSKEGCAEGECGACTVVLVKPRNTGSQYVPVNSCLMLLPMAGGQEVYTVEALARGGELLQVQQAMVDAGGSQCGYCTPGFVVSMFAEQYRPDRTGPCDPRNLGGNLCRCTGYRPIRDALAALSVPAPGDPFRERLNRPAPQVGPLSTDGFARPATLEECVRLLAANPAAPLIAGGTDLGVDINLKGKRFEQLISIEAIPELRLFEETGHEVIVGAGLSLEEIAARWSYPPFAEWTRLFASPLIRNRATLGGNLATASPVGDGPPFLLALDAAVRVVGPGGSQRRIPLSGLFPDYRKTALQPGELIVAIHIPKPLPRVLRFYKVAKRRIDDISTVAAAFALCGHEARIGYGGVAPTPVRCREAERPLHEGRAVEAKEAIARTLHPISDHRGSAAYRLAMAQSLLDKFLFETSKA
jgi:xanthine dehydrogenase small subunit